MDLHLSAAEPSAAERDAIDAAFAAHVPAPVEGDRPTRSVRIFLSQVQLGGPTSVEVMSSFWRATAPA